MRTRDDTDRMHALYERLFALCDEKCAADHQTELTAEQSRKTAEQTCTASIVQTDMMHGKAKTRADRIRDEINEIDKDLIKVMTEANLSDAGTALQAGPASSGANIWQEIQRHQREAQSGLDLLQDNLARIRKTRSRWWWLLMFAS